MVVKLGCPHCSKVYRLKKPFPPEGKKYRCTCGTVLVVTHDGPFLDKVVASFFDSFHEGVS